MRIFVTGCEGRLMQATSPGPLKAGHDVIRVDDKIKHGRVERGRPYDFTEGNLTERSVAPEAAKGRDTIIGSAAETFCFGRRDEQSASRTP